MLQVGFRHETLGLRLETGGMRAEKRGTGIPDEHRSTEGIGTHQEHRPVSRINGNGHLTLFDGEAWQYLDVRKFRGQRHGLPLGSLTDDGRVGVKARVQRVRHDRNRIYNSRDKHDTKYMVASTTVPHHPPPLVSK
jgi:hypothetical protein